MEEENIYLYWCTCKLVLNTTRLLTSLFRLRLTWEALSHNGKTNPGSNLEEKEYSGCGRQEGYSAYKLCKLSNAYLKYD